MSVTTKSIRHWPQTVVSLLITVVVIAAIIISALAIAALTIVHASPAPAMLQISVVEKGSRKPLNHATVILDDNDIYAITNDKGFAKLPVIQYPANLTITAFGYESKHIVVDRAVPTFVVYLPLSPYSRDKIVISAQRLPQQTSKIF